MSYKKTRTNVMGILNLLNVRQTYRNWKSKRLSFGSDKVSVVISNLEIEYIHYTDPQNPPSSEEIKKVLNEAIRSMTTQVMAEFGFTP
jgi:signal recognition particle subunit SEC65